MNANRWTTARQQLMRSPGFLLIVVLVVSGVAGALYRFVFGLQAATNLDHDYPWGLWKALNVVAGIAISAGGFTTAALVYVFHRDRFHAFVRPALLAAALGYTFAVLGLIIDLGRYYSIWHPILPSMWQGDSVLFEVAMCVMTYLTIMYLEFVPALCERFAGDLTKPRLSAVLRWAEKLLPSVLPWLIILGVVVSCLHQSSLGNLMLIAPSKMHPLWNTPVLGLLFLLSAITVGIPAVIVGVLAASWSFGRTPDMKRLGQFAQLIPPIALAYLAAKLADIVIRDVHSHLWDFSPRSLLFLLEIVGGLAIPIAAMLSENVRRSPGRLFLFAFIMVLGVVLNRLNVVLVAYTPPNVDHLYWPSFVEVVVSVGLLATMVLCFRVIAGLVPVISTRTGRAPS